MITYINSAQAKLFELAREALIENNIEVSDLNNFTLPEYLSKLAQLKEISPKYVRLPLYEEGHEDEEIFEIDANARAIKVPASFSRNGVGVVSDELAETLWFRINRYFDIKDFGLAADADGNELRDGGLHILIQWEAPDGEQGASWAYAIDADTDPDYIYFGWALTAEHLTAKAGTIKFGVRILEYDVDGIAYSFATQAAQITVKPGLGFDVTNGITIEDVADKISSRLMGGQIAHAPVFAAPVDPDDPDDHGGNLAPYLLTLENGQAVLRVTAAAPSGETYDAVAYKWYRKGSEEGAQFELIDPEDDTFVGQFTPALTVTASGEYYVVVFGTKEITDDNEIIYANGAPSAQPVKFRYHTSVASSKSTVCVIPAPIKLRIESDLPEVYIMRENPALTMQVERQQIDSQIVGDVTLRIEKTASVAKVENPSAIPDSDFSVVNLAAADCPISIRVNDSDITISLSKEIPGAEEEDDPTLVIADEGYYRATVVHTLNGTTEETPEAGEAHAICRVVKPAAAPTNAVVQLVTTRTEDNLDHGIISDGDSINAVFDTPAVSDGLTIQWYKVVGTSSDDRPDTEIPGATGLTFMPQTDGSYYYIVTNTVENTSNSAISTSITFNE